jgi:diadenosine tetraphosphate (Ap4A) HIT family hydrolase
MDGICKMIEAWRHGQQVSFIHEFPKSILVLNETQFYRGHCMLLLKDHKREFYHLRPEDFADFAKELYAATAAVDRAFSPLKLNVQCLGNQEPHVHWHIIPRYASDPNARTQPFSEQIRGEVNLNNFQVSESDRTALIASIHAQLVERTV